MSEPVIRGEPLQDLLVKLTKKAWKIWWERKNAERPISHRDAAIEALSGNQELSLPSDATSRVSVESIVARMQATARENREKRRNAKEAAKAQPDLFVVESSVAPSLARKKPKASQGVLM